MKEGKKKFILTDGRVSEADCSERVESEIESIHITPIFDSAKYCGRHEQE